MGTEEDTGLHCVLAALYRAMESSVPRLFTLSLDAGCPITLGRWLSASEGNSQQLGNKPCSTTVGTDSHPFFKSF
jgi:hypothetical protein